jgi:hypothetical protein
MKINSNLIIGITCLSLFLGFLFQKQALNDKNESFTVSDTLFFKSSYFDCMDRNEYNNSVHAHNGKSHDPNDHVETNSILNKLSVDVGIKIESRDRWYWREETRDGLDMTPKEKNRKKKITSSLLKKDSVGILDNFHKKEKIIFKIDNETFDERGFFIDFDHGVRTVSRVYHDNDSTYIKIKVLESYDCGPSTEIHIAGNIGYPEWKKKD